ncbi:MAG: 50S ribosomal protein L11 methyltransferase [Clostridia bacterium]|nr:50S ribosomal protein L11 methyltransferase [Clostridia bacterium]
MSDWTEIKITVPVEEAQTAGDIANMAVPYGIYIEDYSTLEQEALEIAHIDLIDDELLAKDRSKAVIHIYISPEENPAEAVAFLEERYTAENVDFYIEEKACKNSEWENNWKKYFKPMPMGEKLLIRPVWEDEFDAQGRTVLHLEPGLAFGSGTHDTTRLCLEALEKYAGSGKTVLDVGCGSGILSIAAMLLGCESAQGVDIDALAVKTAAENAVGNGFNEPQVKYVQGNLTDKINGKFDIILANIVADIVIRLCDDVKKYMNPGTVFITSGIILPREDEVLAAFERCGLTVTERRESGGWLCFETVLNKEK